jgi:hypothetical protein
MFRAQGFSAKILDSKLEIFSGDIYDVSFPTSRVRAILAPKIPEYTPSMMHVIP